MHRRISLLLLAASGLFSDICSAEAPKLPPQGDFHLFLLVGQSNMAGRGTVEDADKTPHPRVLSLDKAGQWVPAVDPLHFDKPAVVGVGLGKTFATLYAEAHPGVTVGIIPCAVGGSPIAAWMPTVFYPPTKSHPWDDAMSRAHTALKRGTLKGILWHQGESDSTAKAAPVYEPKLHDLITRMRKELSAEEVPFIVGQMGSFADAPAWDDARKQVDAAHRSLSTKVKLTGFAPAEGLGHRGDKVHFDSPAYRELGRRFYAAFSAVVPQSSASTK
jgi:pimeloyl-ACP methyl ester carboxylesterase